MLDKINQLYQKLFPFVIEEGMNLTSIPYLNLYFYETGKKVELKASSSPIIYIIIHGSIHLTLDKEVKKYSQGTYFFTEIESPLTVQVEDNSLPLLLAI